MGFIVVGAPPAHAQSAGGFAVGGELTSRTPGDSAVASGGIGLGLTWRFGHGHEGFGWGYGLGWYSTDISRPVAGVSAEIGELHIRPFMGGYGYTHIVGRTTMTAEVVGGYAFVSISQHPALADVYRDRLGARSVTVDAGNAFVVRPGISAWYDINEKVGLHFAVTYTVARPDITVGSSLGSASQRIRADMFAVKIGAVYSIF
jgi:hypothetical protein